MKRFKCTKIITFISIICIALSLTSNYSVVKADEEGKYDPRELQLVTSVKDQSTYGVCWDFAGIAALESYLLKNNYGSYDLSEEHLRLWATLNNGCGWNRNSDGGAGTMAAPGYFTSYLGGVKLESDIPYKSYGAYNEYPKELDNINGVYRASDIEYIDNDKQSVKDAIIKYGAVATTVYYSTMFLNRATSAYNCKTSSEYLANHNLTIVGWDDNYSRDNFIEEYKPANNGAWLVKNSQGPLYSESGFLWISYEDKYILNQDNNKINYSIKSVEKVNDDNKIYEYDDYGATTNLILKVNNEKAEKMTYVNVFNFDKDYDILDKVMINTVAKGAKYKLYYAKVLNDKPVIDDTMCLLDEGIISYKGYMTFDFNDIKIPEGKGAIVLDLDNSENNKEVSLGIESNIKYVSGSMAYIASANSGESFVYENNNVVDINEAFTDSKRSLSIKAINKKHKEESLSIKNYYENKVNVNSVLGSVRLTTDAEGGNGALKYKFIVYKNGEITFSCKYRDKNNILWKPNKKGKYTIYYKVKDSEGNEVRKSKNYEVK